MGNTTEHIYNYVINLFKSELKDVADSMEKLRKILVVFYNVVTLVMYATIIITVIGGFVMSFLYGQDWLCSLEVGIVIIILVTSVCFPARVIIQSIFASRAKKQIYSKIYQALDENLTYIPGKFKLPISMFELEKMLKLGQDRSVEYMLEKYITRLDIFPYYDHIRMDDIIVGKYNGHEVKIIEFSLVERRVSYHKGRKRTRYIEVFHGALFQTSIFKNIATRIYIKQKNFKTKTRYDNLGKVELESNEFARVYDIYSDDQIESRYFLTPSAMENFLKINDSGQKISAYVSGNDISILIHTDEDMFEPNIHKKINDPNTYFDAIFQAKLILDMITELKLDSTTKL